MVEVLCKQQQRRFCLDNANGVGQSAVRSVGIYVNSVQNLYQSQTTR